MTSTEPLLLIHWLGLGLVLVGLTLFFTAFYFRRQSKCLSKALSDLYSLNQKVNQDALEFFEQSWPILASLGCLQMVAKIQWFGEKKTLCLGMKSTIHGKPKIFHISRDDIVFDLEIRLNRKAAESGSLSFLVIKTFLNMLEQNLVLKQAELLTSQKRLERYQLFIQHEIKNIAQFVQLLSEQVSIIQTDKDKLRLIERLYQTLPVMADRAQKTILHMNRSSTKEYQCTELNLHSLMQEVVDMFSLNAKIEGEASVCLPVVLLTEAFKNVLGNFRDHAITEKIIGITIVSDIEAHSVLINIACQRDVLHSEIQPERLFEPFWTTSESGLGLGLFLARELLKQMNAQIQFEQQQESFGFCIKLPINDCLE